jgi:HTH-type transcriptional regulator, glycine betaine synthesis regulator
MICLFEFPFCMKPRLIKKNSNATPSGTAQEFELECVGFFEEVVQVFGIPKSVGQIYGLLYASPRPLIFSDIVERLEISKGSASQGLQFLRSLGAVNASRQTSNLSEVSDSTNHGILASRSISYEPELSLRKLLSGVLRERIVPLTATGKDRLVRLRAVAEQQGEAGVFCLDRVEQLETWRRRLKTVLPVLTALLGPKTKK